MDIIMSEREKKLIRLAVWLLRKKLGEEGTAAQIHDDMRYCGNAAIAKITKIINESADLCKGKFQKDTMNELSELGLWVCYKDTAYRDAFFWILNEILNHAEELKKDIAPYIKDPKDWYVNVWNVSKEDTKKKRELGDIPFYGKAESEKVFSHEIQKRRLNQLAGRKIRR